MMKTPDSSEVSDWQRFFAMECNNRAWDLTVSDRAEAEDSEMLDTAHASAFHWKQAGNELNLMRAAMLLAEVHALLGLGHTAMKYADEMRNYFVEKEDTPDWELAFSHAIHAHAAAAAGAESDHAASYAAAVQAIDAIVDEQDRAIVVKTFEQVPIPSTQP